MPGAAGAAREPVSPPPPAPLPAPVVGVVELDPLSALPLPELAEVVLHSAFQLCQPLQDSEFLTRAEIVGELAREEERAGSAYPELPFDEALAALHICGLLITAPTPLGELGYHLTRAGRVALDAGSVAVTVARRFG
ncbi:MAG TPA: hypothetical protein VNR66_07315 [Solirubrobacteraceae bacterium]|nr:hypothetical protein [Solirubrobacteraceae bacterium]